MDTPLGTLILYPLGELQQLDLPPERRKIVEDVVKAVEAYRASVSELLLTKYSEIRDSLPDYLTNPGLVLVFCNNNHIFIT